ncbi:cytochrome P450 monooxygenase [Xylogone sp. PMI_703]|nr:cytochrome P450 monooxygenase [Xylogone sp. PMI_703]
MLVYMYYACILTLIEWHEIPLRENIVKAVARISSRVFVGEELCHNSAWLQITIEYAVNAFIAAVILRMWPEMLRPVIHWFLPPCRTIRKQLSKANNMINQIIMQRRQRRTAAALEKVPSEQPRDTMDWLEEIAQGRDYHPAIPQLMLALATVHTTSDLLTQVLIDLCQHKELFQPLREEIRMILQTDGWKRSSLYKMKLLDSVIKESQRLKPESMVSMRRVVLNDITLSDGTELHKGDTVAVSSHRMWDPEVYPNPEQFDGYRFLKMRDIPGKEHVSQLVSTSPDHLGFGYGKHACPGRFFVANEIKIALCHLLLQYDWMIPEGHEPKTMVLGFSLVADPRAKILVRRRREDMPI